VISNPFGFLASSFYLLPGIAIAIPVHELGHALVALWLGDRTPANRGYFRPDDPAKFFTTYGLLMMIFWRVGWGNRAPVNEYRIEGLGRKLAFHLAGPAANLLVAAVAGVAFRQLGFIFNPGTLPQPAPLSYVAYIVYAIYFANLSVMAFNLLPVPGFDGWRILEELFRRRNPRFFFDMSGRQLQVQQYLLIGLFLAQLIPAVGGSLLGVAMIPFYWPAATLILGICTGYFGLIPCPP
jgi:Zn-dependent protease